MAYEDVCAGRADWCLVKLLWYKLTAWLWKRFGTGTLLVNVAAVSD